MAENTNRLGLPYIQASQAQKHVTHNDAIRLLDGLVQMSVVNRTTSSPPVSPSAGDCYAVASGASGGWSGWDGSIAMWADGYWFQFPASEGWRAWDKAADEIIVFTGGAWLSLSTALGLISQAASVDVAKDSNGAVTGMRTIGQTLTALSGASVTTTIKIPSRSVCLGVSVRTTSAILGATSFDCGISGEVSKFGGSLGVALGSTNKGVIGPTAFYSDTAVILTANGGSFSGGNVSVAIHVLTIGAPVS